MKVLVVDDDPDILEYLRDVLEDAKLECLCVEKPLDALLLCEKETFLAIITDFNTPKMTGLELIAKIREKTLNRNTPIMVLSGALDDGKLQKLERLGIIDVMSKPPEIDILLRIIGKAQKRHYEKDARAFSTDATTILQSVTEKVMREHLGKHVSFSSFSAAPPIPRQTEYAGMVTFFGRKVAGILTVSYEAGFSREFANTLLGREATQLEVEIFESTTGEIAEQVALQMIPQFEKNLGLNLFASPPTIVKGRWPSAALPDGSVRMMADCVLNELRCCVEFAFLSLDQKFKGKTDSDASNLLPIV